MGFHVIPHPPYSPDLTLCDFFMLLKLNGHRIGINFDFDENITVEIKRWFVAKDKASCRNASTEEVVTFTII